MSAKQTVSPAAGLSVSGVWRADACAGRASAPSGWSTGYARLDAELPGQGWPVGGLVELLLPPAVAHRWQLLIPALADRLARHGGPLVLVGTPPGACMQPFAPALAAQGLPTQQLLWVRAQTLLERLWACEQTLNCPDVAAVLTWLMPPQPPDRKAAAGVATAPSLTQLRRLHVRALAQGIPLFALRDSQAAYQSSAAPLRLQLHAGVGPYRGQQEVHVLKRPGAPSLKRLGLPDAAPAVRAYVRACRSHPASHALAGLACA